MNPVCRQVTVSVPATSANLGSGFDSVGLALDYHDDLTFTLHDDPDDHTATVIIHGEGESTLPRDESHLVVSTFRRACQTWGLGRCGFTLESTNRIPQARGMGSSAEAIVAAIAAADAFAHDGESARQTIFDMAATIEGHPDNVAPAVFGGLTVSWNFDVPEGAGSAHVAGGEPMHSGFHTVTYPVDGDIMASVFVPDVELSTQKARQALPATLPHGAAVANISRAALLPGAMSPTVLGWSADDPNGLLLVATQDAVHQPFRASLMPSSWDLIGTLRAHGYAAAVSGAGPCVLVLHHGDARADIESVARDRLASGHWRALHLGVDTDGVRVERLLTDAGRGGVPAASGDGSGRGEN
ncbi:homoserine kinase [Bifidobacterium minimum]|uniref:Homoserine kinase n=1 Tax=Bifidobacterium minimum TaxID=1693 RepID=A0A087BM98_9BIFI|nr:homoserine kinase [Bifidobacterium minimum]